MTNINLVPEVKKEQANIRRVKFAATTTAIVVGGILLAVILVLGSILGYRNARISAVKKDISKINDELVAYKELEESVRILETGLVEIKGITDGGRNWTEFYENIEKAMPADVRLVTLKISGNSIDAGLEGSDIRSIDRFIKSFSNFKGENDTNLYSKVVVDGYTMKDGKVSFQAKFDEVGVSK